VWAAVLREQKQDRHVTVGALHVALSRGRSGLSQLRTNSRRCSHLAVAAGPPSLQSSSLPLQLDFGFFCLLCAVKAVHVRREPCDRLTEVPLTRRMRGSREGVRVKRSHTSKHICCQPHSMSHPNTQSWESSARSTSWLSSTSFTHATGGQSRDVFS
jgi:hypothetical protein